MKRKVFTALLLPLLIACLMGATVEFDGKMAVNGNKITGKGKYSLDAKETLSGITFRATDTKSKQENQIGATVDATAKTWTGTVDVVPGTYSCVGIMFYKNAMGTDSIAVTDPEPAKVN